MEDKIKKPELSDFGLTEDDIKLYHEQVSKYEQKYSEKVEQHRSTNIFEAAICGFMTIIFFILYCYYSFTDEVGIGCLVFLFIAIALLALTIHLISTRDELSDHEKPPYNYYVDKTLEEKVKKWEQANLDYKFKQHNQNNFH